MKKYLYAVFLMFPFSVIAGGADECLMYKTLPRIDVVIPEYNKNVVQPDEEMEKNHGTVEATLIDNYDVNVSVYPVINGFCVVLNSVKATIGFSDFLVKIDSRNVKDSCEYNAVLGHEEIHINEYLGVIEDMKKQIYDTIYTAAKSVIPEFIRRKEDINSAMNKLNNALQTHPDVVLIKQKIQNEEELRNKKIDLNKENNLLVQCENKSDNK